MFVACFVRYIQYLQKVWDIQVLGEIEREMNYNLYR